MRVIRIAHNLKLIDFYGDLWNFPSDDLGAQLIAGGGNSGNQRHN